MRVCIQAEEMAAAARRESQRALANEAEAVKAAQQGLEAQRELQKRADVQLQHITALQHLRNVLQPTKHRNHLLTSDLSTSRPVDKQQSQLSSSTPASPLHLGKRNKDMYSSRSNNHAEGTELVQLKSNLRTPSKRDADVEIKAHRKRATSPAIADTETVASNCNSYRKNSVKGTNASVSEEVCHRTPTKSLIDGDDGGPSQTNSPSLAADSVSRFRRPVGSAAHSQAFMLSRPRGADLGTCSLSTTDAGPTAVSKMGGHPGIGNDCSMVRSRAGGEIPGQRIKRRDSAYIGNGKSLLNQQAKMTTLAGRSATAEQVGKCEK